MTHILIVRTSSLIIDFKTYNCQETGLAMALAQKGYKVTFVTPGKSFDNIKLFVTPEKYVDVYTVTFSKLNRNICWYHGYFQLLKNINPDLIHINSISLSMSYFTLKWAQRNNKKTVVIQGNYQTTQKPILKQLEILFNKTIGTYIINHTNGIGCKTKWASDFIKSYSPDAETNLTRIGLDISKFAEYKKIDWKRKLNIEKKHMLLYIGAIEPRRNPIFLIDLIHELSDDYCLVIVGSGKREEEIKKQVQNYGIESRCKILGKLSQDFLPSLYKDAELFLLPSNYEIFGMVILESMYFGTPVISTLTAGSDTIISNDIDGVILKTLDIEKWKTKILNIVGNNLKLLEMSALAKQKICNQLTWEKASDEFINLYNKALNEKE